MIKAKKSLGQNFLIDDAILDKIVNTTDVENKMAIAETNVIIMFFIFIYSPLIKLIIVN